MTGPRDDPYAFSFSGLKTAVARYVESNPDAPQADVAAGFQEAVADVLTRKAVRAATELGVSTLLIAGGVAANSRLRELAEERCAANGLTLRIPRPRLCTDNGAMIASFAAHLIAAGAPPSPLDAASDPGSAGGERTGGMSEDKLAVTELLYRYAELIDAGDFDAVGQLLARATFGRQPGRRAMSGADAHRETVRDDDPALPRAREHAAHPASGAQSHRRDQRRANRHRARSTFCVIQNTETVPLQPIVVGRYFDTFSCDDAGWYFTERQGRGPNDRRCVGPPDGRPERLRRDRQWGRP